MEFAVIDRALPQYMGLVVLLGLADCVTASGHLLIRPVLQAICPWGGDLCPWFNHKPASYGDIKPLTALPGKQWQMKKVK